MNSKHAIVIGINNYKINPLKGCINDANKISNYLENNNNYNVHLLLNNNATKQNIINKINELLTIKHTITNLVFFFSGHGSLLPKYYNNLLNIIYTFDFFDNSYNMFFSDFELFSLLLKFEYNTKIEVVLDRCHDIYNSNNNILNDTKSIKVMGDRNIERLESTGVLNYNKEINNRIIRWSSSKNKEISVDRKFEFGFNGVFTFHLLKLVDNCNTRQKLFWEIKKSLRELPTTTRAVGFW